jgi:thiol:disulfide interchange protein
MKKLIFVLLGLFFINSLKAQVINPIKWTTSITQLNDNEYQLNAKAVLDKNWHIYSSKMQKGGPIPVTFQLEKNTSITPVTEVVIEKGTAIMKWDSAFKINLIYYADSVIFSRKVKVSSATIVKAKINFMLCNDATCLPPDQFEAIFDLKTFSSKEISKSHENTKAVSLLYVFFLSFLGGFAALLTPCVFPLIPMTVSFFTKTSKTKSQGIRNALIYSIFIIVLYVSLGLLISGIFGIDALNAMSTNVWFNLIFFIILILFAASFLGAFEITIPSGFVNKIDAQSDRGGIIGIFFMALTLALVSFSCTGPIIGTLLFESAVSGNIIGPMVGMLGFSTALALPFGLFALFPNWLKSLPKSGSWLHSVKVVLGLLEIALAFKFLSNADLVIQSGILTREVFISIWIGVFATLTFYLFGFIKFSHDDDKPVKISVGRAFLAIIVFSFTVYMIPGLWGSPLKLISGFPPPDFYKEWNIQNHQKESSSNEKTIENHCPNNLDCFHDYGVALAYAKKVNKPILLDFTGWACVNCRKMEGNVWTNPRIDKLINT